MKDASSAVSKVLWVAGLVLALAVPVSFGATAGADAWLVSLILGAPLLLVAAATLPVATGRGRVGRLIALVVGLGGWVVSALVAGRVTAAFGLFFLLGGAGGILLMLISSLRRPRRAASAETGTDA